jgi:hypothetical protein
MSQIGISIERTSVRLAHVNRGETGWYYVQCCDELLFNADLYSDLLDKGYPKLVSEVTQKLSKAILQLTPQKVAVCLNLTGAKFLKIQVEKNLPEALFEEECQAEAALFLRQPNDYIWQAVQVSSALNGKYEHYVLVFLPRRYLTRLRMLLLPLRKEINLIDIGHIAMHYLQSHTNKRMVLLEIEPNYLALSSSSIPNIETLNYWTLEAETDAAYFALTALRKLPAPSSISLIGSAITDDVISFIQNAVKVPVTRAILPKNFVLDAQITEPEKYLKAIGCAVKAMSL